MGIILLSDARVKARGTSIMAMGWVRRMKADRNSLRAS